MPCLALRCSCENEIKVIQHFARVFKQQLERYPRTREEDEADIRNGTYEFGSNHRNVIVVLRGEKIVCEYYVNLEKVVVPLLQMQVRRRCCCATAGGRPGVAVGVGAARGVAAVRILHACPSAATVSLTRHPRGRAPPPPPPAAWPMRHSGATRRRS